MAVARNQITIAVVNDGKGERTYIRYSDDNGKTFTKSKLNHIIGDIATSVAGENRSGQVSKQWSFNRFDTGEVLLCALVEMSGNTTESPSMYFQAQPNGGVGGWDVIRTPWTNLQNGVQVLQAVCTLPNSMTDNGILNMRLDNVDGTIKVHDLTLMYRSDVKGARLTQDNMFLSGKETGKYIGVMSWDKENPPLDPSTYTWSEFKGQDAEMYKLNPLEESAVVGEYGGCNITLRYEIRHVIGNKETKYTGNDVTISVDSRVGELNFTKKSTGEWECMTTIVDFTKKNLGSFNINVMKDQQVLDTRVVPVTYNTNVLLEASQKLGAITASVKGVSRLIHNMFVGSTFLEPIEGAWGMVGAAVDKGVKYNGSDVVLIQNIGATQDSYHGVYFFIEGLVPQKKYTISAMVLTNNLTEMDRGAAIEIKMTDNGQDVRLCDPFPIVLTKENEWQKVEFTFTTPDRITSEKVQVRFQLWRNGHLWISQPMMNQGEVAADYTANIKDIQLSLAQIKVTANTISQSITDLSTGLESVGIHLNGAEKKITLHGDTEMVDANGKHVAMFKDGKIITEAIDADKVVTKGIQSKTIDAKDATFNNVNVSGKINASSGKIAGFNINSNGLTNDEFDNDAYVIFRNDRRKSFAGFGGNVLPASSGAKAVARFENCDEGDFWGIGVNYAILASAQGMRENIAMQIDGGALSGVAMRNTIIGTKETSKMLGRFDYNIVAINENDCILTLPEMKLHDDGHVIRIKRLGSGKIKVTLRKCYTFEGTSSRLSLPYLVYGLNRTLIDDDTLALDIASESMEFVWVRDVSRTINGKTYHGMWLQYKLPSNI